MKFIITILLSSAILFAAGMRKSGDVVVDKQNKLIWQDHKHNTDFLYDQDHAIEYCEKLTQSGSSSWRLPTVKEYKYIIDKTRKDELMINRAFYHIKQAGYWTQDRTWRTFGLYGYYIFFKSGAAYYENRTYPKHVRCVRDM